MRALVIGDTSPHLGMPLPDFVGTYNIDVVTNAGDVVALIPRTDILAAHSH